TPLADLVREPPLAPLLHLDDLAAQVLDPPGHAIGDLLGLHLVVARLEDVDRLVLGHVSDSSSRTRSGPVPEPVLSDGPPGSSGLPLRLNRFMRRSPRRDQV